MYPSYHSQAGYYHRPVAHAAPYHSYSHGSLVMPSRKVQLVPRASHIRMAPTMIPSHRALPPPRFGPKVTYMVEDDNGIGVYFNKATYVDTSANLVNNKTDDHHHNHCKCHDNRNSCFMCEHQCSRCRCRSPDVYLRVPQHLEYEALMRLAPSTPIVRPKNSLKRLSDIFPDDTVIDMPDDYLAQYIFDTNRHLKGQRSDSPSFILD